MSPLAVRRYRAERLLREQFRALQGRVNAVVARRLSAGGIALDERDLEACYAIAWQGLYEAILEGKEIVNPAGWLVLVTYRRAVDEQRSRTRAGVEQCEAPFADGARSLDGQGAPADGGGCDHDPSEAIADRLLLRHLFEGLRASLTMQEREAAVLCYLHGLTRAQAAAQMGISDKRMRRLMDGRGPGRPGVSVKLGTLVASIREGRWCEQQASLMRGLAFGILDPAGERYRIAMAHTGECPACRAYVASLRGLSVAVPPALLPGGVAAAILGAARASTVAGAGAGGLGGVAAGARVGLGGSAAAGAGAGGAGGGWVLAGGPLGAKLAAGCLLALGIGAGCVGLGIQGHGHRARAHADGHVLRRGAPRAKQIQSPGLNGPVAAASDAARGAAAAPAPARTTASPGSLGGADRAAREFGPEQSGSPAVGVSPPQQRASRSPARTASTRGRVEGSSVASGAAPPATRAQQRESEPTSAGGEAGRAEREFAPG